jgi:hypothetical protein
MVLQGAVLVQAAFQERHAIEMPKSLRVEHDLVVAVKQGLVQIVPHGKLVQIE